MPLQTNRAATTLTSACIRCAHTCWRDALCVSSTTRLTRSSAVDTTPTESTGSQQFTWSGGRSSTSAYTIDAASDNRHDTLRLEPCPARPVANNATQLLLVRRGCPHPSGGYKSRTSRAVASVSSGTARKLRDLSDTTRSTRWAGSPSGRTSSGTCAPTYVHDRTRRLGVRVFTGCVATNDGQQATV